MQENNIQRIGLLGVIKLVHNFENSQRKEEKYAKAALKSTKKYFKNWGIKKAFLVKDIEKQKKGIDAILIFRDGTQTTFDFKITYTPFPDVFIEQYSRAYDKLGWLLDPNHIPNYIIYFFVDLYEKGRRCNFNILARTLKELANYLFKKYPIRNVDNGTYFTTGCWISVWDLIELVNSPSNI